MKIELTHQQTEEIAIAWIRDQQQVSDGYKQVLNSLFMGAHFATWSWLDAIKYAVKRCSKSYAVTTKQIAGALK